MADQYTFQDTIAQYPTPGPPEQSQDGPGLDADLQPHADHGEDTYRGSGRLEGRRAIVTGGDSGIGRAVAIAFAREGADLVLSYLPEEQEDAEHVAQVVRDAGRKVVLAPGDVSDQAYTRSLVRTALDELGGLDTLAVVAGRQQYVEDIPELTP